METFNNWIWSEKVWLPENYTWSDVKTTDKIRYTEFTDLIFPVLIGIVLIAVRWITERYFLEKVGVQLGLKPGRVSNVSQSNTNSNPLLESSYEAVVSAVGSKKLGFRDLEKIAKKSGLGVRQVERWIRRRYAHHRPSRLKKFTESGWKFICYGSLWIGGLLVLVNKTWFWNILDCWNDYPNHNIDTDIWWYYIMSTSFYWSLFISQFNDVKRKDFWQMFIHHVTTIGLLCFSWVGNLTSIIKKHDNFNLSFISTIEIGSLVILLHDTADVFLEIGKMAKYASKDRLCDMIFGLFTILWIVTRLGIYPCHILNSTLFEATKIIKIFPAYYIFNTMLVLLLFLHVFWTYFIFKVALSALSKGKYEDSRSSSDDDDDKKNS